MNVKTNDMDMLHGALTRKLLLFTLPIALSSMIQQLFNAADTAVVGYLGNERALAAVGTTTEIIALIVTVSSGLSTGANILIAKQIGRSRTTDMSATVQGSMLLAGLVGIMGLFLGQAVAEPLLRWIQTPTDIFDAATLYLRIYMLGYPFLLLYDFGAAVLRAHGDSRYPFLVLLISGIVNVGLNLIFVIACRMNIVGVALATDISTILSALVILYRLVSEKMFPLPFLKPAFPLHIAWNILKTGIPTAVQGAVFCFANMFIQAAVNIFGETAIAGSTIAMNFEYFTYYIITAFGQAATTFTSQNYAARQYKRCRHVLCLCLALSTVCSSVPIFMITLFRDFFSHMFTPETAVIKSADVRIMCILLFEPICNLYEIPSGVLRGSGHALYPAISTIIGTCAFRILWICTVFRSAVTLPMLYHAFPLSWVVTIVLMNLGFLLLHPLKSPDL